MKQNKPKAASVSAQTIKDPAHWPDPEVIRQRAHEIFEKRGGTPGHELEDWLNAERELKAKIKKPK